MYKLVGYVAETLMNYVQMVGYVTQIIMNYVQIGRLCYTNSYELCTNW